eukprot:4812404-Amphidinium_carterae.1
MWRARFAVISVRVMAPCRTKLYEHTAVPGCSLSDDIILGKQMCFDSHQRLQGGKGTQSPLVIGSRGPTKRRKVLPPTTHKRSCKAAIAAMLIALHA